VVIWIKRIHRRRTTIIQKGRYYGIRVISIERGKLEIRIMKFLFLILDLRSKKLKKEKNEKKGFRPRRGYS